MIARMHHELAGAGIHCVEVLFGLLIKRVSFGSCFCFCVYFWFLLELLKLSI
jgi:hypothetical protein